MSITAGAAGSAEIAEYGLTGRDAMEFVREFLASDVPGSQKTLYSILAGAAIAGAVAGAGITGASALAFGAFAGLAYESIWQYAYDRSSSVDWNRWLDPVGSSLISL